MALVYGKPGSEYGDKRVFEALEQLSDRFIVYAQPMISNNGRPRFPDYILIDKEKGVIVIEVKDWVNIVKVNGNKTFVNPRNSDSSLSLTNPTIQARKASYALQNLLKRCPILKHSRGKFKGKLKFPVEYACFLPHQEPSIIKQLSTAYGENRTFGFREIENYGLLIKRLKRFPYRFPLYSGLTEFTLNKINELLIPRVVIQV
jgi:hypothetical protein